MNHRHRDHLVDIHKARTVRRFRNVQTEEVRKEMNRKLATALCAISMALFMCLVPLTYAVSFQVRSYYGRKAYEPWGSRGQTRVHCEMRSLGGEDPYKVCWMIVIYGSPTLVWWVYYGVGNKFMYGGNYYTYKYGDTYYVDATSYGWSMSQYLSFDSYTIRFYYDGRCYWDVYRAYIEEIGDWPPAWPS